MSGISAVLIACNEAHTIGRTLRALQSVADEIIVLDSGSTDGTQDIACSHGAQVHYRAFDNYGSQKRHAVSLARYDWVLALDADEVITPELAAEIKRVLAQPTAHAGYWLPITLVFLGRRFRASGEAKRPFLRLFDRRKGGFTTDAVHEKVLVSGPTAHLHGEVLHYSYRSLAHYFHKFNNYTSAGAQLLHSRGKRFHPVATILRMPLAFVKIWFLKAGFLDGYPGLVWAICSSLYPVVKYTKLLELQRNFDRQQTA